jgi:class 3 adenylate cyclase/tetratricopeptide (TPR) repeat protein
LRCTSCDRENPGDAAFCAGCGTRLQQLCRGCERTNAADAAFCNGCGRPLDEGAAPTPPVEAKDPREYTPKHLADKILTTKSALEGERKLVTVLFVDLKGSMDLAESIDPEAWHTILDRFFAILADGVHRFEGTVNQYTGDGIMALFGAPITHEDHAHRACYAALRLAGELRDYVQELKRERGVTFSTRMGINSGEVVVGKIGDDLRMDYTAQGHTVGLAARMEQLASPDTIYLTEHTAALVTGFFELRDLGSFNVKGVQEPVIAHELAGVGAMRTRLDVSRSRGFSKFVGRAEEMAVLENAFMRAQAGHGQVVGVVADAGTGKSRLCFEFLERLRAEGTTVYTAHGVAHGKAIPYLPILELFRGFFAITEQDSAERAREKIAGRLLLLSETFRESLPMVFDFLGVEDPERPAPRMDPDAWRRQFHGLVRRVSQERGRTTTSVTLLEDLHWFDSGSDGFLEPMIDAAPSTRSLLIVNFRPEYHAEWMQRSYYQQLPLLPLGGAAIRELLDDLLGSHPSLEGLADSVHERTAGNPFFIEEVVQSLVEAGSLRGSRGAFQLATSIDELAVPATVQAVLGARIDRLTEREKNVLQTGSVIGKKFPESVIERIAELPDSDLASALRQLVTAEFIYEEALYPEAEYAFKHPLTQEVAYHSQLGARRARVHAAAARVIEELHSDKLDEQAALLAHHWEEAGERLQAARWNARAAEWAGTSDAVAAVRHWRKVIALLSSLPDARETDTLRLEASAEVLAMGWRIGMPTEEMEQLLSSGKILADRLRDPVLHAKLLSAFAGARGTAGDANLYYEYACGGAHLAREAGDTDLADDLAILETYGHHLVGKLPQSSERCEAIAQRMPAGHVARQGFLGIDSFVWHMHMRAENHMYRGQLERSMGEFRLALETTERLDEREIQIWVNGTLATCHYWRGEDPEDALRFGRRALELAENVGSPVNRALSRLGLVTAHLLDGSFQEAVERSDEALEIMQSSGAGGLWESLMRAFRSEAQLRAGDLEGARATAEEAVARARACATPVFESLAHTALARAMLHAASHRDLDATAAAALDRAEALAEQTGARVFLLHCAELRAELAGAREDAAGREAALRAAVEVCRAQGATGRARRLEAVSAG